MDEEESMKAISAKMLASLVAIGIAIPFFTIAVIVGAHALTMAQSSTGNMLIFCVTCCAAAIGVVNGLGRRTPAAVDSSQDRQALDDSASIQQTASIHLGF
jgi:hypothetical protein